MSLYSFIFNKILLLLIITLCLGIKDRGYTFYDLEATCQDFVLETKRIEIPNFTDAFNPSIVRWKGHLLLSFRIRDPLTTLTHQIGLVWLDDNLNIAGEPCILQKDTQDNLYMPRTQDPRLITVGADLYMVFNEFHDTSTTPNRRMAYTKIHNVHDSFYAEPPTFLLDYENENPAKQEKNWVPFVFHDQLLLSYSIEPHLVLQPAADSHQCLTVANTFSNPKWNWGILRGGTPAVKIGDEYLAFFHSVKDLISEQSEGARILHYFMGAYTFNAKPPFNMTKISPEPIIGKNFYNGPKYNTWKPLLVVFPGGFVHEKDYIWISYGRQDHETWIVKLDKQGLLNSLIPVSNPM